MDGVGATGGGGGGVPEASVSTRRPLRERDTARSNVSAVTATSVTSSASKPPVGANRRRAAPRKEKKTATTPLFTPRDEEAGSQRGGVTIVKERSAAPEEARLFERPPAPLASDRLLGSTRSSVHSSKSLRMAWDQPVPRPTPRSIP